MSTPSPATTPSSRARHRAPRNNDVTIIRRARENPYFSFSRTVAQMGLSLEALGLLTYLLSLPDDWQIRPQLLAQHNNWGRDKVYRVLRQLEEARLIRVIQRPRINGRVQGVEYRVYDTPYTDDDAALEDRLDSSTTSGSPHPEKPDTVKPDTDSPDTVFQGTTYKIYTYTTDDRQESHRQDSVVTESVSQSHDPENRDLFSPSGGKPGRRSKTPAADVPVVTLPDTIETELRAAIEHVEPAPDAPPLAHKGRGKDALMEAVCFAFDIRPGAYAGQIRNLLTGRVSPKTGPNHKWAQYRLDEAMTPAEICGFRLWYKSSDQYGDLSMPSRPDTLADKVLQFRADKRYDEFVGKGERKLAYLLRAEATAPVTPVEMSAEAAPPAEPEREYTLEEREQIYNDTLKAMERVFVSFVPNLGGL